MTLIAEGAKMDESRDIVAPVGAKVSLINDFRITHSNGVIAEFKKGDTYRVVERASWRDPVLVGLHPCYLPSEAYIKHMGAMSNCPSGYCFWIEEHSLMAAGGANIGTKAKS